MSIQEGGKILLKNSDIYQVFYAVSGRFADPKMKEAKPGKKRYGRDF
ncbi:MAG TPA: hypothetical protein VI548_01035 [Chitinophagaceae bacterium]|nr:hypothetical protein [Chitinophagaceae bacterium]